MSGQVIWNDTVQWQSLTLTIKKVQAFLQLSFQKRNTMFRLPDKISQSLFVNKNTYENIPFLSHSPWSVCVCVCVCVWVPHVLVLDGWGAEADHCDDKSGDP